MAQDIMALLVPRPLSREELLAVRVASLAPSALKLAPRVACSPREAVAPGTHSESSRLLASGGLVVQSQELEHTLATLEVSAQSGADAAGVGLDPAETRRCLERCRQGAAGPQRDDVDLTEAAPDPGRGSYRLVELEGLVADQAARIQELEQALVTLATPWPDLAEVFARFEEDVAGVGFDPAELRHFLSSCRRGGDGPWREDDTLTDLFLRSCLSCLQYLLPSELQTCLRAMLR